MLLKGGLDEALKILWYAEELLNLQTEGLGTMDMADALQMACVML